MNRRYVSLFIAACLGLTFFLGCIIRTVPLSSLEATSVLDPDSARYLRQSKIILDQGHLPEIDSFRLYPIGKDSATQLSFYPYILALLYKSFSFLFRGITLETIATFSPLFFFSLSLIIFYLLIRRLLGWPTALLATNLCTVVPPTLGRSVVGYADRDAFCLFLVFGSYYLYIRAHQSNQFRNRLSLALLSGVVMMLLTLTWQGVGLFIAIIVLLNFIIFLFSNERLANFHLYFIWFIPVAIGLLGFKPTYHDLAQPHAMLAVCLPCGFAVLVMLSKIISKFPSFSRLCTLGGKIPLGFALTAVTVGLGCFVMLLSNDISELIGRVWANFFSPFGSGRLMASVEELQKRGAMGWSVWPGYFLFFIAAGVLILVKKMATAAGLNVWASLIFFEVLLAGTILTRFASMETSSYESPLMIFLYTSSLIIFAIGMVAVYLWSYHKQRRGALSDNPHVGNVFLLVSFCVLLFITRGAVRFEFFFAPVAMALGCYALVRGLGALGVPNWGIGGILPSLLAFEFYAIGQHLPWPRLPESYYSSSAVTLYALIIAIGISAFVIRRAFGNLFQTQMPRFGALVVLIFLLMFLGGTAPFLWLGGYADLSYAEAAEVRPVITQPMSRALKWLEHNTPQSSVIAAWWDYGSFINLLGHRATIIDEEQLDYWIHLMARDVLFAETDWQALQFLKAHGATHLLITGRDLQNFREISNLVLDKDLDRFGFLTLYSTDREIIQSQGGGTIFKYSDKAENFIDEDVIVNGKAYPAGELKINDIYLKLDGPNGDSAKALGVLIEIETEHVTIRLRPETFYFKERMYQQSGEDILPCTLLVSSHADNPLDWQILCLSPKVRNSLMVRLYLLNQESKYFRSVYPPEIRSPHDDLNRVDFSVRIWEIHYPDNFPADPEYLRTDFPDAELRRLWRETPTR